eukprot:gene1238-32583_t
MIHVPSMLLDPWVMRWRGYDNQNGLVLDPAAELANEQVVKAWSEQERQTFMDKFLQNGQRKQLTAPLTERLQ